MKYAPKDAVVVAPLTHDTKCPVCRKLLEIVALVEISDISARVTGATGLGHASSISVLLEKSVAKIIVKVHECTLDLT